MPKASSRKMANSGLPQHISNNQQFQADEANTSQSPQQKRTRGPSRALDTLKLGPKQKFKVEINKYGQPIGEKAQKLSSFIGTLARDSEATPLSYPTWKDLPQTCKDNVWNHVVEKYEGPGVKLTWVMKQYAKLWRCWRSNLRKFYKKHRTLENCMKHSKVTIPEDQWRCLIQHFETERSKAQSERNKAIRAKQKFPHTTGTKSFARFRAENVVEDQPELSRAEVFIMTQTSKRGDYHNQVTSEAIVSYNSSLLSSMIAVQNYQVHVLLEDYIDLQAQINEAMSQLPEGAKDDPSPTDILSRVMGPDKYGRVRTYGIGVKPSKLFDPAPSRNELMAQNAILHGELDNLRSRVNQVEAVQAEKMRELEASAEKVNELQAQVSMLMTMIKNKQASRN